MVLLQVEILQFLTLKDFTTTGLLLGVCWYLYNENKKSNKQVVTLNDKLFDSQAAHNEALNKQIDIVKENTIALNELTDALKQNNNR